MSPEALLRKHGVELDDYGAGRHYAACPKCSRDRKTAAHRNDKVLGVTIDADGSVRFGCNHCGWTGPEKGKGNGNGSGGPPLTSYVYRDKHGTPRFRKVRNLPGHKPRFWLERSVGARWTKGTEGVDTKILYRANEVAQAIAEGKVILLAEGEKDVDRLWSLGIAATCNAHGASEQGKRPKWTTAHSEQLKGADIIVLNDNDGAGYAHAEATCKFSLGYAKRVRRLDLKDHWPEIPEGGDVSDWLAKGHTGADLEGLIAIAPEYAPLERPEPKPKSQDDDAELARLAKLPLVEYERARKAAAQALGFRASTLDLLVASKRMELGLGEAGIQGRAIEFQSIEPWPEAVHGARLLDDLSDVLGGYLIMAREQRDAIALWAVFTHAIDVFDTAPKLVIGGPSMRVGKTRALECLDRLVRRPLLSSSVSAPVLFRVIEDHQPTILIDEFDAQTSADKYMGEALRGVLNSGFNRAGARVLRSVAKDKSWEPRAFSTWAAVALAGIGKVPATVADRSIVVTLQRKRISERVRRLRRRDGAELNDLARKIVRFVADCAGPLSAAEPKTPEGLNDRAADAWEPLIAIADVAGGAWPRRAREAALKFVNASETEALDDDVKLLLLTDIRDIFTTERLSTKDLLDALHALEERPWNAWGRSRKPLTDMGLAGLLKPYGIRSQTVRLADGSRTKGYARHLFTEVFARYLPQSPSTSRDSRDIIEKTKENDIFADVTKPFCHGLENEQNANQNNVVTASRGQNAHRCAQCNGHPDGAEQHFVINNELVWLHPECQRFYVKQERL
jgi:putative DNA primase/helicase